MGKIIKPGDLFVFKEPYFLERKGVQFIAENAHSIGLLKSKYDHSVIWLNDCKLTRLIYNYEK